MSKLTDPRRGNNFIDAMVLDRKGVSDDAVIDEILTLAEECKIALSLPHSVKSEIEHPNTPSEVKLRATQLLYTLPVQLTPSEINRHGAIRTILQGNAKPGKHDRDAWHIVESDKYGRYFITNDERILKKRPEIAAVVQVAIITPADFLGLYRSFEGEGGVH